MQTGQRDFQDGNLIAIVVRLVHRPTCEFDEHADLAGVIHKMHKEKVVRLLFSAFDAQDKLRKDVRLVLFLEDG